MPGIMLQAGSLWVGHAHTILRLLDLEKVKWWLGLGGGRE